MNQLATALVSLHAAKTREALDAIVTACSAWMTAEDHAKVEAAAAEIIVGRGWS